MAAWPSTAAELELVQEQLASRPVTLWRPSGRFTVGACYVCFAQEQAGRGEAGDLGWAAASLNGEEAVAWGAAPCGYEAGLLALREGALLERAVLGLSRAPDVLLVDATGRDHPRRAGLALHLGAVLGIPTVGVTHRPLLATGDWPEDERGATSPLLLGEVLVGYWVRTRRGARPLAVHSGWRTGPQVAVEVVLTASAGVRTPEPLRRARAAARLARTESPVRL